MKQQKKGIFCVSLDFEMFWGMQDAVPLSEYGENVVKGRQQGFRQLKLFEQYGIHATWGTVGMLLAKDKTQLLQYIPEKKPSYHLARRNPYRQMETLGETAEESPYYYARDLVDAVLNTKDQELGSHTFSHYFCTEEGQTTEQFRADLSAAVKIGRDTAYAPVSLIFPRNQSANAYAQVAADCGFICYRGEEDNWIYRHIHKEFWLRAWRMLDSYFPLTGHNCHRIARRNGLIDIPGSAFLRPYKPSLRLLEGLKMARVRSQMRYAAKHGLVYHLYWHPHNLGAYAEQSFKQQEKLFQYFLKLNKKYGFESLNMREAAELFLKEEKR